MVKEFFEIKSTSRVYTLAVSRSVESSKDDKVYKDLVYLLFTDEKVVLINLQPFKSFFNETVKVKVL